MNRRSVAAVVAVLLVTVVTVQLLDPRLGDRNPPTVNFSEPPAEVAADSARQFEYVDYAYRIDFRRNRSEEWRQVRTMQVDHTDHEYYKTGPIGEAGVVLYGNDAVTFVRPGENASWRVTFLRDVLYHPKVIGGPFLIGKIRSSDASVVMQNRSWMVVRLQINPLNVAEGIPGNSILRINKRSWLIESVSVTYKPEPSRTNHLRFRLTETHTDVSRPKDIPFSSQEIIWDILRGPIVNL